MSKVRADRCFRLTTAELQHWIDEGWNSGWITWTIGGYNEHKHTFTRSGGPDNGAVWLEYDTIYHGHQAQTLGYERGAAGFGRRLFWFCPSWRCGRRVTVLYRPHGGNAFVCRHCWNVGYASQYESKSDRFWRNLHVLEGVLMDHSAPWREVAQAHERWTNEIAPALAADSARDRAILDRIELAQDRRRRGRGRPSPKRQRREARARLAALRAAMPKRPPGRPKEKRLYVRRRPLVLTEKREDRMEAFCPRCRDRRELVKGKPILFSNGRPAVQGECAECGARMARIVAREKPANSRQ